MKRLWMMAVLIGLTITSFAQTVDLRRKIDVTGTAEQEVTPDIIYVSISLKEYMDGKNKVTIDRLEQQLQKGIKDAGISKDDLTINNVYSYNYTIQKKKSPDFLASKQYRIKVRDLNKYNDILSAIDDKGIQSTGIESYDYSKIDELKRELKVKALLAAREKATYLLGSIGEKVGSPINIEEINNESYPQPMFKATLREVRVAGNVADTQSAEDIDVKKIKLNYQMHVVFEIAGK